MQHVVVYQNKSEPPDEIESIEKEYGFKYSQVIGEILYALLAFRLDLSYSLIKLSPYSTKPSRIHFEAAADLYRYLNKTNNNGIYFWRSSPHYDLTLVPFPVIRIDQINT